MFERFSDQGRKVMQLTWQVAQDYNLEVIDTEALLLGLLNERKGTGARALMALSSTLKEKLVAFLEQTKGKNVVTMGKIPQTPKVKKILETALHIATGENSYVDSGHLALAFALALEDSLYSNNFFYQLMRRDAGITHDKLFTSISEIRKADAGVDIRGSTKIFLEHLGVEGTEDQLASLVERLTCAPTDFADLKALLEKRASFPKPQQPYPTC